MRQTIVEDRVLARIALEAVAWNTEADPAAAEVAFGRAVIALRVMGVAVTAEVARAMAADIALVLADPAAVARVRGQTRPTVTHAGAARAAALLAA